MLNIRWMALARFVSGYSMPDFSNLAFFFRSAFELCSLRVSQHRSPQAHNLSLRPRCHQSHLSDSLAHNLPPRRQKCLTAAAVPPWGPLRPARRQKCLTGPTAHNLPLRRQKCLTWPSVPECPRVTTPLSGVACVLLGTWPLPS